MLLFFRQMLLTRARVCVCVVHWHCTAQLSMFNMEKRFRNKIIIIILLLLSVQLAKVLSRFWDWLEVTIRPILGKLSC